MQQSSPQQGNMTPFPANLPTFSSQQPQLQQEAQGYAQPSQQPMQYAPQQYSAPQSAPESNLDLNSIISQFSGQNSNDLIKNILSQRLEPTANDIADSGLQNLLGFAGLKYTAPQEVADARATTPLTTLAKIAEIEKLGKGTDFDQLINTYQKLPDTDPRKAFYKNKIDKETAGATSSTALGISLARIDSDPATANLPEAQKLALAKSGLGIGNYYDETGVVNMPGFNDAVGNIEGTKARRKELGKQLGEADANLNAAEAGMPQLEAAVAKLDKLAEIATYTTIGTAANTARRQAGLPVGDAGVARAAYIASVKNNILPQLRRTFGAQFTKAEGDSLLATLGDPDTSYEERNAVLKAFIEDKRATLETLRRETGKSPTNINPTSNSSQNEINFEDLPD